jgi:hypothetical protein
MDLFPRLGCRIEYDYFEDCPVHDSSMFASNSGIRICRKENVEQSLYIIAQRVAHAVFLQLLLACLHEWLCFRY